MPSIDDCQEDEKVQDGESKDIDENEDLIREGKFERLTVMEENSLLRVLVAYPIPRRANRFVYVQ